MFTVSALYIYPVKSLGGFSVTTAEVTAKGFKHDRRWMLVDTAGKFFTQRELPSMALLQTAITDEGLYIYQKDNPDKNITIPFLSEPGGIKQVKVWDDICDAWSYDTTINAWFTEQLETTCELVYMPDDVMRTDLEWWQS